MSTAVDVRIVDENAVLRFECQDAALTPFAAALMKTRPPLPDHLAAALRSHMRLALRS